MVRIKKDGQFFNCYLRKDILNKLTAYSDDTGIPKTIVVEKALQKYLNEVMELNSNELVKR